MFRTLATAFSLLAAAHLVSCCTRISPQVLGSQHSNPQPEIVYCGIPAAWDAQVKLAIHRISPSYADRYIVMKEDDNKYLDNYLEFSLYIDHPGRYERVETYRLSKDGTLSVFNMSCEDNHDMWLPFESNP